MGNNTDGHQLLAIVATVHHERVGQALDDGALGLAEPLGRIATSRVRKVNGGADLDVVARKYTESAMFLDGFVLIRLDSLLRVHHKDFEFVFGEEKK